MGESRAAPVSCSGVDGGNSLDLSQFSSVLVVVLLSLLNILKL